MRAIEGVGWLNEAAGIEEQLFAARASESEPALLGASAHLLVTGRAT